MSEVGAGETRLLRRAAPADALRLATALFEAEQRVDMNTLNAQLGVRRSTLYRWVGDREQLIDQVILGIVGQFWVQARAEATGVGVERTLSAVRAFMRISSSHVPLRAFVQREPALALRILMNRDGGVSVGLREGMEAHLTRNVEAARDLPSDVYALMAHTDTALVWANVVAGHEPSIDAAIEVMRAVLKDRLPETPPGE